MHKVQKLSGEIRPDAAWDASPWDSCSPLVLRNLVGPQPVFTPEVEAKLLYDEEKIMVFFKVKDRYVRCVTNEINGSVWEDSCVEFFFAPDQDHPERYFNLEVNCGGTALLHYNTVPRKEYQKVDPEEVAQIKIAHSLPVLTNPERTDPVTWTIGYAVPFSLLEKYAKVSRPKKGVSWRANFYKIADKTSHPHYISWAPITNGVVDFHQPQFFGVLKFE